MAYVNRNFISTDKSLHTNCKEWEREKRRNRIVDISDELIMKRGFDRITFKDIATVANR